MQFFDAHFHVINPQFKLIKNNNYLPDYFVVTDYFNYLDKLNLADKIMGGAVVSGSFQGFDQDYLIDALKILNNNKNKYIGVTQLPIDSDDQKILALSQHNIRAIRYNFYRGSISLANLNFKALTHFSKKVFDLAGWHTELYLDNKSFVNNPELFNFILTLPKASIDHLGLSLDGSEYLLKLAEKNIKIKATGFMRFDTPLNMVNLLKKIYAINPTALLFGTDLPATRASRCFDESDLALIINHFTPFEQQNIFYQNSLNFYNLNKINNN